MELSHKWFERFLKEYCKHEMDSRFRGNDRENRGNDTSSCHPRAGGDPELSPPKQYQQAIFGIIQGGVYKDLRRESTKFVNNLDVFGIAIGGALGKDKKEMYKIIDWINEEIDYQRPHHLLGIGDLETIEEIIKRGIDLFDCALPTRIARHGTAMTEKGYLNLTSSRYKKSFEPIEKNCQCPVCQKWTKAQINFLFRAKESLAGRLLTIHNLYFLEQKLKKIRERIKNGKL